MHHAQADPEGTQRRTSPFRSANQMHPYMDFEDIVHVYTSIEAHPLFASNLDPPQSRIVSMGQDLMEIVVHFIQIVISLNDNFQ